MNMQYALEAEAESTGIVYPRASFHKKKDGRNKTSICDPCKLQNSQITEAIEKGRTEARKRIHKLGMADLLEKNNAWLIHLSQN